MSDFLELLKSRRSIRKFEDRPVSDEVLHQVMEAVRWSQSWANTQCWEVIDVVDPELRSRLQQTMGKGNPATKTITSAPKLLVLVGKKEASGYYKGMITTKFGDWLLFDLGIACQDLCLAAHALGLGTVVVGLFDQDKAAEICGVPEGYELVAMVPMGYPAQEPKAPKRKEVAEFLHTDKF